jgi:hypothetical protein
MTSPSDPVFPRNPGLPPLQTEVQGAFFCEKRRIPFVYRRVKDPQGIDTMAFSWGGLKGSREELGDVP